MSDNDEQKTPKNVHIDVELLKLDIKNIKENYATKAELADANTNQEKSKNKFLVRILLGIILLFVGGVINHFIGLFIQTGGQ